MSAHSPEAVHKHIKLYLLIGAALIVGTAVTVWAASIQFGIMAGIAVAALIATIKGSLVAGYFMHLLSERKLIYVLLIFTAFFTTGMVVLTRWAFRDQQGKRGGAFQVPAQHVVPAAHDHHGE